MLRDSLRTNTTLECLRLAGMKHQTTQTFNKTIIKHKQTDNKVGCGGAIAISVMIQSNATLRVIV